MPVVTSKPITTNDILLTLIFVVIILFSSVAYNKYQEYGKIAIKPEETDALHWVIPLYADKIRVRILPNQINTK